MPYPDSMVQLIEAFSKLPGVGIRTAERFAFYILRQNVEEVTTLSELIVKVNSHIHYCQECFNLSENQKCHICSDSGRDRTILCVVQEPKDIIAVEKSGDFKGLYHVLLGALSPLEGIGPQDIRINELMERCTDKSLNEVIIGTSSDTEGEATAHYIIKQLKKLPIKITRIAYGVPVGSSLEFADKASLSRSIRDRKEI